MPPLVLDAHTHPVVGKIYGMPGPKKAGLVGLFNEVLGVEVEVPEKPSRIISFSPAVTESIFDLGAGDRVVGVSAFCARPPEATKRRKVGSYNTVRREILDSLSPDLIFTVTGYQREFARTLAQNYPVYPLELPVTVAGIVDFMTKVGLVIGENERAREKARTLLSELATVRRGKRMLVYVEADLGGPVSFGAHSYITDAIELLGCETLYSEVRREWLTPDLGVVAKEDPDVVIYEPKMFAGFKEDDIGELLRRRGWENLRAVKSGSFFVTPGPLDFLAHHGPSFITQAIPWLEEKLRSAEASGA